MNVAIYLRKSRADIEAESRGEGETLSKHRRVLLQLARKNGYAIEDIYEEIASGERILERPQMQALLTAVQADKYDAVLCMEVDRLGRGNQIDQGMIQEAFKESNTKIVTPRKVYDLTNELDEEWSEFESFMARRELKIITRRMQRGRRESVREGKHVGRKPPFGYLRGDDLKLVPDPETASVVRLMYQLSADGLGFHAIARYLDEHGIKTPTGRDHWAYGTVQSILKNPAYLGHMTWGRRKYNKKSNATGYSAKRQDRDDWIVAENSHEPLIDEVTYQRHLERVGRAPKVSSKRTLSNPMAGLVYCSKCGYAMYRQKSYGGRADMLVCKTRGCASRGANIDSVEQATLEELASIEREIAHKATQSNGKRTKSDTLLSIATREVEQHAAELSSLRMQLDTLHELLERRVYDDKTFFERSRILNDRVRDVESRLKVAQEELARVETQQERQHTIGPALLRVIDEYPTAPDVETKNELLKSVVHKIVYTREKEWSGDNQFQIEIHLRT